MKLWHSFKAMPSLLKFLTVHALACFVFFLCVAIPNDSFKVNGKAMSFGELWSSGIGPFVAILGLVMPATAILMLRRTTGGRQLYLGALTWVMVGPDLFMGNFRLSAYGVALVALVAWYLFAMRSVRNYFASTSAGS